MKTIREQVEMRCKHFTGIQSGEVCKKGVHYDVVKIADTKPYRWPCLKGTKMSGGTCAFREDYTPEEVDKKVKEIEDLSNESI
ncbi:MAG: hypothetical protein OEW87_10055 [Flavobacteriaceae bacterium]|nr:hypothetical protein [Flavobacteriaceae bacterium]